MTLGGKEVDPFTADRSEDAAEYWSSASRLRLREGRSLGVWEGGGMRALSGSDWDSDWE